MAKEFTKRELIEYVLKNETDGMISQESIANLVFDGNFPKEQFDNAKNELISARDDENRFKELSAILLPKWTEIMELEKKNTELAKKSDLDYASLGTNKAKILKIQNDIRALQHEFSTIQKRIQERKKK